MANVDDVKDAIEGAMPAGRSRRARRLPAAVLLAVLAGAAAWASRLAPVRSVVGTAVSTIRTRVASLTGRGTPEAGGAGTDYAGASSTADAYVAEMPGGAASSAVGSEGSAETPFESPATDLAAADATSVEPPTTGPGEDAAASAAEPETIPADSEEGRPAGV